MFFVLYYKHKKEDKNDKWQIKHLSKWLTWQYVNFYIQFHFIGLIFYYVCSVSGKYACSCLNVKNKKKMTKNTTFFIKNKLHNKKMLIFT